MKREKYANISATHHFLSVGIETWGVFGLEARATVVSRSHRGGGVGGSRFYDYNLQRISLALQQGNVVVVLGTSHIPMNDIKILD